MILVKMLEPVNGKEYALWRCGRCSQPPMRMGYKVGRNRGECYQCEQRTRFQEVEEVFQPKNLNPAIRECLMCGIGFESKGIWNRRCTSCNEKISYIEVENNHKRVKHDATMQMVGDCVASEEEMIRGMLY